MTDCYSQWYLLYVLLQELCLGLERQMFKFTLKYHVKCFLTKGGKYDGLIIRFAFLNDASS